MPAGRDLGSHSPVFTLHCSDDAHCLNSTTASRHHHRSTLVLVDYSIFAASVGHGTRLNRPPIFVVMQAALGNSKYCQDYEHGRVLG